MDPGPRWHTELASLDPLDLVSLAQQSIPCVRRIPVTLRGTWRTAVGEVCEALMATPLDQPTQRGRLAKLLILLPRMLLRIEADPIGARRGIGSIPEARP